MPCWYQFENLDAEWDQLDCVSSRLLIPMKRLQMIFYWDPLFMMTISSITQIFYACCAARPWMQPALANSSSSSSTSSCSDFGFQKNQRNAVDLTVQSIQRNDNEDDGDEKDDQNRDWLEKNPPLFAREQKEHQEVDDSRTHQRRKKYKFQRFKGIDADPKIFEDMRIGGKL